MKRAGHTGPVHLSFVSDPYQPNEKEIEATRQILEIFAEHGIQTQILTKSGEWGLQRDMELLKATRTRWGTTLTLDDDTESISWEPGAALPQEHIAALQLAKSEGLTTWVSLEPVINPEAVYRLIQRTQKFVDEYRVGKLNHHKHAKTIDWPEFRKRVSMLLTSLNAKYVIKKGLWDA